MSTNKSDKDSKTNRFLDRHIKFEGSSDGAAKMAEAELDRYFLEAREIGVQGSWLKRLQWKTFNAK